jgi:hypothetical protein
MVFFAGSVPSAYVVYCIAAIPFAGGTSVQPSPSAFVVEADDGRAFATRGVFKGERISADDLPYNSRTLQSQSRIDVSTSTAASWDLLRLPSQSGG